MPRATLTERRPSARRPVRVARLATRPVRRHRRAARRTSPEISLATGATIRSRVPAEAARGAAVTEHRPCARRASGGAGGAASAVCRHRWTAPTGIAGPEVALAPRAAVPARVAAVAVLRAAVAERRAGAECSAVVSTAKAVGGGIRCGRWDGRGRG